jgi:TrpR-related protein YerC/YecD
MNNWNNKDSKALFTAITRIANETEARNFFRDLLTEKEIIEFSNRWKAAKMLNSKISYAKIIEATGLSSTTVARISKWLNSGMGGYKTIIKKDTNHHTVPSSEKGLS